MSYQFVLPSSVENRIFDYALYIAEDSPTEAIRWLDQIISKMQSVCEYPQAQPVAEVESELLNQKVRKVILGQYVAFYFLDKQKEQVVMIDFRHGAKLPDLER